MSTSTTKSNNDDENEAGKFSLFRRGNTVPASKAYHGSNEENDIDPDDGNSSLCRVCNLPIFSTPFVKYYHDDGEGGRKVNYLVHDQCDILPKKLKNSVLHPGQPLILQENDSHPPNLHKCYNCSSEICGNKYYACDNADANDKCSRKYDVLCAFSQIRILHKSHEHRLMAIPQGTRLSGLICGACGTRHDEAGRLSNSDVSYLCNVCSFWIHPDCALLPNAIESHGKLHLHQHHHPLALNYRLSSQVHDQNPRCAYCGGIIKSVGDYFCTGCRDYRVHIMCAVSDPQSFTKLWIGQAQLPDLLRLPIPDEHTSVIRCATKRTTTTTTSPMLYPNDRGLHEHPLTLRKDDDHDDRELVCNACVQFISPPFYSCSECPHFFLHDCCAHLQPTLTQHPAHKQHPLTLFPKSRGNFFMSIIGYMDCCYYPANGFAYSCKKCYFDLDVLCALMPTSITHEAHSKAHILSSSFTPYAFQQKMCECCGEPQGGLCYTCGTCRNFRLHSWCALLPKTVRHRFDEHPLKLITKTPAASKQSESNTSTSSTDHDASYSQQQKLVLICEICEKEIDHRWWYYGCNDCDYSFHISCIPSLDRLNKIKFGGKTSVNCHDCPLTLIRGLTLCGSHCGKCGRTFEDDESDLAFECSKCDFRIHYYCAEMDQKTRTNSTFS